jgi:hypothetical protein
MQQRRVRLGDILDDYCPRERRVTNHAVVAMVEDDVKQTRCTTCDAEHEYKHAKVPAPRRRKPAAALADRVDQAKPRVLASEPEPEPESIDLDVSDPVETADVVAAPPSSSPTIDAEPEAPLDVDEPAEAGGEDEWPVHRPLIRATLPRPEGQVPERKAPDFTIRQPGGGRGFDRNRPGGQRQRGGGHRPMRHSQGQGQGGGPQGGGRFGGQRQGGGSAQGQRSGHPQRHGSGSGPGHTGGRPGQPRGQRSGGGGQGGRKRGR